MATCNGFKMKRRRRFNEKARQGKAVSVKGGQAPPDTNYTVLIPRASKTCDAEKRDHASRTNKRLSSRQKKKLKAVIENKRKKEKVSLQLYPCTCTCNY